MRSSVFSSPVVVEFGSPVGLTAVRARELSSASRSVRHRAASDSGRDFTFSVAEFRSSRFGAAVDRSAQLGLTRWLGLARTTVQLFGGTEFGHNLLTLGRAWC